MALCTVAAFIVGLGGRSSATTTLRGMADAGVEGTEIADSVLASSATPLGAPQARQRARSAALRAGDEDGDVEPGRLVEGPAGVGDDPPGRARRPAPAGGTIVEPTSGNTGVGLAIVAAQRGYRCVFVMTDKVAPEKIYRCCAYGAEVVVCPVAVAPEDPASYYSVAARLPRSSRRSVPTSTPTRPTRAHELTTGPELWRQTAGRITHFVAERGDVRHDHRDRALPQGRNPDIKIIAADPRIGVLRRLGTALPRRRRRRDFFPEAWQPELYDEIIAISDEEASSPPAECRRPRVILGGSGGLAVAAAIQVAAAGHDDIVVVLNPDSGAATSPGCSTTTGWPTSVRREYDACVSAVLETRGRWRAALRQSGPDRPRAIEVMKPTGSASCRCARTLPFANAEVSGSIDELDVMEAISRDAAVLDMPVERVMGPRLPTIGVGQRIEKAVEMLEAAPALLVLRERRRWP